MPHGAGWRLGLVLGGIVTGLVIVEGGLRLTYTAPWYERLIADQRRNQQHKFLKNADGLRDGDYESPKPADHRRVLILGDSFTFGAGVFDESAVFPRIIDRRLNEQLALPAVRKIDVLNGGISGSLTKDWVALWRRVADRFDPDVVLLVFFLRDGTPHGKGSIPTLFGPTRKEITVHNSHSLLYRHSYIYRLWRDHIDRINIGAHYIAEYQKWYFGSIEQTAEWREAEHNLIQLRDLAMAKQRSTTVGLAVFPILFELDDQYPFKGVSDLIAQFAEANGIPACSLLPAFLGRDGPDLWVSAYDQHPNALAHRIAADYLLPFVEQLLQQHETLRHREAAPHTEGRRPSSRRRQLSSMR